jgi:hypothetical protein
VALHYCADRLLYTDYAHYRRTFEWNAPGAVEGTLLYHAYWSGRLGPLHHLCLRSLLLTQSPPYEVWLWLPPADLASNRAFIESYGTIPQVHFRVYDIEQEARGTVFERHLDLLEDARPLPWRGRPVRSRRPEAISDGLRLLVVARYGGIYFDMDTLFLRDLRPLTGEEFIYQWSNQPYGSNAISHFRRGSAALWGLAERAVELRICGPAVLLRFSALTELPGDTWVLPSFVFDPLWIAHDTRVAIGRFSTLHDFFELEMEMDLDLFFPGSYAYDWHNHWNVPIRPGTLVSRFGADISARFATRFGVAVERWPTPTENRGVLLS